MTMKRGLPASFFPLLVLAILAGLSFWLDRTTEVPHIKDDGNTRHDPDIVVDQLTLYRHDIDGLLKYKLTAPHLEHYPDDNSSLISNPRLLNYRPDGPVVELTGDTAIVSEEGKRIQIRDNVVLRRAAFGKRSEMTARTPELSILPDEGRAFNQHPVHITEGRNWIKGTGLQMDNQLSTFSLQSRVRGEYFRNRN
jgi:lipopolysaccharide export system protein LptC